MSALVSGQIASNATAAGSSITATLAATPTSGNLLVAVVTRPNGLLPTVAGFTLAVNCPGATASAIYYKTAGVSESRNVVASVTTFGYIGLIVYEFSGGCTQLSTTNANSGGSSTSGTTGAVTVLFPDEVLMVSMTTSNDMGSTAGWSSPFITNSSDGTRSQTGYITNPSAGSKNGSITWTNSFSYGSVIARFIVPGSSLMKSKLDIPI